MERIENYQEDTERGKRNRGKEERERERERIKKYQADTERGRRKREEGERKIE